MGKAEDGRKEGRKDARTQVEEEIWMLGWMLYYTYDGNAWMDAPGIRNEEGRKEAVQEDASKAWLGFLKRGKLL